MAVGAELNSRPRSMSWRLVVVRTADLCHGSWYWTVHQTCVMAVGTGQNTRPVSWQLVLDRTPDLCHGSWYWTVHQTCVMAVGTGQNTRPVSWQLLLDRTPDLCHGSCILWIRPHRSCIICHRLAGLVVKASTSRAGFNSRLHRGSFYRSSYWPPKN